MRTLILVAIVTMTANPILAEDDVPWWKREKIRFMWGCWGLAGTDKNTRWDGRAVPREVFRNVALSGATVFTDTWYYKAAHARLTKEYGMKYFAPAHLAHLAWLSGDRTWINEKGEEDRVSSGPKHPIKCPLDQSIYEHWLVGPVKMQGIREGIIDGIHVDWEATEGRTCYCDDCFTNFVDRQGMNESVPEKDKRFDWLKDRGHLKAYEQSFHQQRVGMFTRIRDKLRAIRPDLLFSSYNVLQPHLVDFLQAMHTAELPFLVLDARHYQNDDRQPWWESYSPRLKQEDYLYIAGGWTNALFGSQPSQVSAARWIYETSINEDGCWLWFEHELTNDNLRAYAAADREIKAVQSKVGKYLFHGTRDLNFVTAVEWSGRPELEKAIVHRTYHLGNQHLVHINNIDTEWPLRVRVRFTRLSADKRWTVQDPMGDLFYSQDDKSAMWPSTQLKEGVVVAMEPRSDLFLLISPVDEDLAIDPSRLIYSREFDVFPGHARAAEEAGPVKLKRFTLPKGGWSFKMDTEDAGVDKQWFLPDSPLHGWKPIEIERFWGSLGNTGIGWYRADVNIPALPTGKQIYLHFGAVDEELMLWIDGKYVGEHNLGPDGWDKPFTIDVTGKLTGGKHHVAMRVYNSKAAGGVWKPISIMDGPAIEGQTQLASHQDTRNNRQISNQLLYTATEPLGLKGFSGIQTIIANTIRAIDDDGANESRVRQLNGHLWSPTYSRDGRIAFVHDAGGRGQINIMNADGSGVVNVSNNTFCDRSPDWSPDGAKITFMSDREGDWDIWVMNDDGSGQRQVAGNPGLDRAPSWSPDGSRIAWESHVTGMPNIWTCEADGQNSRPLIDPNPESPMRFQAVMRGEKGVFQPDGWVQGKFQEGSIGSVFADHSMYLWDPAWSPDGRHIAAGALHTTSGETVALLAADGSSLVQLIYGIVGVANVTWSPDGTQLAGTLRTAPQETERSGIFVVKADGIANTDGAETYRWLIDVTPQGPRLGGAKRPGMMSWYAHGSAQPRRVLKTFTSLAWSPDGGRLAFSADLDPSGSFDVYTISPDGGEPNRLNGTQSAWPQQIMWRPR